MKKNIANSLTPFLQGIDKITKTCKNKIKIEKC